MSCSPLKVKLVGILNITPDSFSDGGLFLDPEKAIEHAYQLKEAGAFMVDVGGVSTRPGSKHVSPKEEWGRIGEIVSRLSPEMPISVDTYNSETAERALDCGAVCINDITAGRDCSIFKMVAQYGASVVMMYSNTKQAHSFREPCADNFLDSIVEFLSARKKSAIANGVEPDRIIVDPGMGGFISSDPQFSWQILNSIDCLEELNSPVMLGISRKSFLKLQAEREPANRDMTSLLIADEVCHRVKAIKEIYFRVHDVNLHRRLLKNEL